LYTGTGGHSDQHAHHAVQLGVAIDDPLQVTIGGMSLTARAALIPADVPHSFEVSGRAAFLWADPHGPRGRRMQHLALTYVGRDLARHVGALRQVVADRTAGGDLAHRLLTALGEDRESSCSQRSRHVDKALAHLDAAIAHDAAGRRSLSLDETARAAAISASRLTHLFSQQVGIPFRRYVLWLRLLRAVQAIAAGNDLTGAAGAAGFSDSAHLSRAFRGTFGLPPSALLGIDVTADGCW
jgi:AraC-like DNA-binding protein